MAQFIAIGTRNLREFIEADFTPLLEPEAERARTMYAEGTIRAMWARKDVPGAVILLEADSLEAAQAAFDSLPLAQRGMLGVQIIPLAPYRAFCPRG